MQKYSQQKHMIFIDIEVADNQNSIFGYIKGYI